ncbi:MAG: DUF2207 domain-containing protein [Gammaproteobacteria bacterium]
MTTRLLFLFLLWLALPVSHAEETILQYDSEIAVAEDATMTVTETIRVTAEGRQIKRGIYRDFPTDYRDRLGNRYRVGFEVLSVLKDGVEEPYHTQKQSNGVRIYIGDKNIYLRPGTYTYTLRYRTNRQLGFFDDHDELYWNVTGNDWAFPILKCTATVYLPTAMPENALTLEAYTGPMGGKSRNYYAVAENAFTAYFESTRTLEPKEGLTIVVGFPKHIVSEPDASTRFNYLVKDNREYLPGIVGLALLILYYLLIWKKVGRDPEPGIVIPLYEPPEGFSPASMRFIRCMGYDNKAFSAAVINLAVKGHLDIEEETQGKFTLQKRLSSAPLAPGEQAILKRLFTKHRTAIELKQINHSVIGSAIKAHKTSLKLDYEKLYFLTNSLYLAPGVLISVLLLAAMLFFVASGEQLAVTVFFLFWLSIWSIGVFALLAGAWAAWKTFFLGRHIASFFGALFITLFALPFLAGEIFGLYILATQGSAAVAVFLPLTMLVNYLFYQWLKAPTMAGRKLLDKIDGFKLYLSVAEKDELNFKHPPNKTPELFEKYLPYALALDVEQAWSEKFAYVLHQASIDKNYQPRWYHSRYWHTGNYGDFVSSVGSGMTSAISSSSTAPGSSSGGGGGGSSGGGGGGGGGGGW